MQNKFQKAYQKTKRVTVDTGRGLTEQHHRDTTDINLILKDYRNTGLLKHANKNQGRYDDVTSADFQEAMILVSNAQQMFETLPSETRKQFGNEPMAFLDFVENPKNAQQLVDMGLAKGVDGIDISGAVIPNSTSSKIDQLAVQSSGDATSLKGEKNTEKSG